MQDIEQGPDDSIVKPERLQSLDKVFALAWQLLQDENHKGAGDEKQQRERLARIVLDCMVDGHEPDAGTARMAVDRFLTTPPA
ncbi:MAG: hypothetical protein ACK4K8_16850 [Pannonibacter sp.]